jgi:hypothetical protein
LRLEASRLEALRLETWAVIAASAMVLAVLVGTLPRVSW